MEEDEEWRGGGLREDGGGRGPSMREMKWEKEENEEGREEEEKRWGRWGEMMIVLTSMKHKHDSC